MQLGAFRVVKENDMCSGLAAAAAAAAAAARLLLMLWLLPGCHGSTCHLAVLHYTCRLLTEQINHRLMPLQHHVDWQLRCGVAAQYEAPNCGHAARLLFNDIHQCQLCINRM
jgi:hypothetical protein